MCNVCCHKEPMHYIHIEMDVRADVHHGSQWSDSGTATGCVCLCHTGAHRDVLLCLLT